ncbi:Rieske (2Fe-2S) protein [Ilumatobacter sp.]|uniref:Rieske (2Fe-2S) protein n=1 Tax=Ilumatobacter sp. TaxID=1967498 RepID=UPI003C439B69
MSNAEFRLVGESAQLKDDWVNPYYLDDLKHRVSVARAGGDLYAFDDLYGDMPLSAGLLTGTIIMSQGDGSQWELSDGSVVRGPATEPLKTYEVHETNGAIHVKI